MKSKSPARRPRALNPPEALQLGVVILAAGASSRMGRPKLLLPWGGTTVIGHLIEQWRRVGAEAIAVVLSAHDEALPRELHRLADPTVVGIINPHPEQGMFSSVQCAARWDGWKAGISHIAITLGDQPHVQLQTLRQLVEYAGRHAASICQPGLQGRPKHPVIMPYGVFRELRHTSASTLKEFLALAGTPMLCASDDPGLDLDLDEPDDYERAYQMAFGQRPA